MSMIDSTPRRVNAVIQAKGAPTKYCVVHAHTFHVHTFQLTKISKNPFFVLVLSNIQIFWDTELWIFLSCQL